jgi:mRNA-degrading endonuclease HigB of HigAB toxin-antitoxin module
MAKNYREFEIKRSGFAEGIKVRVFKTPESMRKGYLAELFVFRGPSSVMDIADKVNYRFIINIGFSGVVFCFNSGGSKPGLNRHRVNI